MDSLIVGAAAVGARLVYVDNLYMFGQGQSPLKEANPEQPTSRKGGLRRQLANTLLEAHRSGQVQAAIGRGSDFYGPGATNSLLGDRVFPAAVAGKAAQVVGDIDAPHTYTYIEDFAKGIVTLGEREEALGRAWHIPNAETLTTRQLLALIYEETGRPLKFQVASRSLITLLGLFNPEVREVKEMLYQFESPFVVDHSDYARTFGDFTPTPHREAIRATLAWFRAQLPGNGGDDPIERGEKTAANRKERDRQQHQDRAAVLPLHTGDRPDDDDEAGEHCQNAGYEEIGRHGQSRPASVRYRIRLARRANGADHQSARSRIALECFEVPVCCAQQAGIDAK